MLHDTFYTGMAGIGFLAAIKDGKPLMRRYLLVLHWKGRH